MSFDQETGEVYTNGSRATAAAAQGRMMMRDQQMGVGLQRLHDAMFKALKEMPIFIDTDSEGAHKIKYATLKQILDVVRPALAKHDIRIRQGADRSFGLDDGGSKGRLVPVYTDFIHWPSGEIDRTTIEIPITRLDPQSMGSAITYGRRYSLLAGLGLTTDEADDDGVRAMPRELSGDVKNSTALDDLISAMKANRSHEALAKWVGDARTKSAINRLNDGEAERLRTAYAEWKAELPEEEPKKGK